MKKIALFVATLGLLLATTTTASAKDMTNRFGIGVDHQLGWRAVAPGGTVGTEASPTQALALNYRISKNFGLQLTTNAEINTYSTTGLAETAASFAIGLNGLIAVAYTNDVNFDGVVGFTFQGINTSLEDLNTPGNTTERSLNFISIDLGVRPEWFITEHFSIHAKVGIAISILDETNSGGGGVNLGLFNRADLFSNVGWTFWF